MELAISGASSISQMSSGDGRDVSIQRRITVPSAAGGSSNASGSQYALIMK